METITVQDKERVGKIDPKAITDVELIMVPREVTTYKRTQANPYTVSVSESGKRFRTVRFHYADFEEALRVVRVIKKAIDKAGRLD